MVWLLTGLVTFGVLYATWYLGREKGRLDADLEWMDRVACARVAHMTDLANVVTVACDHNDLAAAEYAQKALSAVPHDLAVLQDRPRRL